MEEYLKNFKNCLQKEIPFCSAECPFDFDILNFIEKSKRSGFLAAFKAYRNSVGFPRIVSEICPQPCKGVCPRKDVDQAIDLNLLEKACISFAGNTSPTEYNLPTKKKKIAVIGAGMSGLACALRLATKKYEVEIWEKSDRIGGILWDLMDPNVFLHDIEEQFKFENYVLHLNKEIETTEVLAGENYHAVYVATGKGGADFGLQLMANEDMQVHCEKRGQVGWFAGGGVIGSEPIDALADGLFMGTIIDNFLKTGNLKATDRMKHTAMCFSPKKISFEKAVKPSHSEENNFLTFSKEEAENEALRCLECQCDACRIHCDLADFYNKWPLRIRDEVLATTLPGSAEVKATPAKRLMSTCSQCGLCKETCPESIDLGGLILAGRRSMHKQKKAPWVFHDFWMRDMDFANGEHCSLVRVPGEQTKCEYAFFPGCQLGASEPQLVEETYKYLLKNQPDTGIMLKCCGVPAEWAGHEEKHKKELDSIRCDWISLGKPTLIMACPTCQKKFKEHLKEIPVISLYEVLDGFKNDNLSMSANPNKYEIFHPCSSCKEEKMRQSLRDLSKKSGYNVPRKDNENLAKCCSYGGQPGVANPGYAKFVINKRMLESDKPYITYCINCRDGFLAEGKKAVHILELLFPAETSKEISDGNQQEVEVSGNKKPATLSKRYDNRLELKRNLLKKHWGDTMKNREQKSSICVNISEVLQEKLSRERILEEDMIEVVAFCEKTDRKVYDIQKDSYGGYKEVGYMTYWVEYKRLGDTFELINAYTHRIKIEMEAVWNGRKTDYDLPQV